MRMFFLFTALILSILVSGCTTVTEQDLADLQSSNAIVKKEAVDRISRGPVFPFNLMGSFVSRENEKKAVALMAELLATGKESKDVKLSILNALGQLGKRTEVPAAPLIELLTDKDPHVLHWAVEALGKTKNKKGLRALVKLLEQRTDKYPIIWALGEIGHPGAIRHLDQLLDSEDKYVTYNAYRALAKIRRGEENRAGRAIAAENGEPFRNRVENVAVHHSPKAPVSSDSGNSLAAKTDQGSLKFQGPKATKKETDHAPLSPGEKKQEAEERQQASVTKAKPQKDTKLYSQALAFQRTGSLQAAKKLYEAALETSPHLVSALNNIGVIYITEKNHVAALGVLETAVKIKPTYVDPYYNLACLYALQNNVGRSLSYLKKAVSADEAARTWARTDRDLENLHGHCEYEKIVREAKSP